jgi:ATP/maltotriose-dependent transcriptional regulator MalT
MGGDFDAAQDCLERDAEIIEALGLRVAQAVASEIWAVLELLRGAPAEAERHLRAGYQLLLPTGETSGLPTLLGLRAEAVWRQGRADEALALSQEAERLASPEDVSAQVQWRGPRAKALAAHGEHEAAERLAREAVAIAATTDFLNLHAGALLDLAEAVPAEARSARTRALALLRRKGNRVAAAEVERLLRD